jgi:hypothetical protein
VHFSPASSSLHPSQVQIFSSASCSQTPSLDVLPLSSYIAHNNPMKGNHHKFRRKVKWTVTEILLLSSTYQYLQNWFLETTFPTYVFVTKNVQTTGSLHALMPFTSLAAIICKLQTCLLAKQLNAYANFRVILQTSSIHDIIVHS